MTSEILVVGHRGWPSRFPDNSLPGFIAAAAVADMVELDVRRSADGKLVLSHDPAIGKHVISETPWSILAESDLGAGAKPCLLDEAIAAIPDTPMFIEIKNQPGQPGFEPDSRLALESAARARIGDAVISFNWRTVEAVKSQFPDVDTGLSVGLVGDLDDAIEQCEIGHHRYLIPDVQLLLGGSTPLPDFLNVFVWSSEREMTFGPHLDELASLGVSGIIVDDPGSISGVKT